MIQITILQAWEPEQLLASDINRQLVFREAGWGKNGKKNIYTLIQIHPEAPVELGRTLISFLLNFQPPVQQLSKDQRENLNQKR